MGELVRHGDSELGLGTGAAGVLDFVPPSRMVPWGAVRHLGPRPGPQPGLSHLPDSEMPKHRPSS